MYPISSGIELGSLGFGGTAKTHLLLVVQALVVVLQSGQALLLAGLAFPSVDNVAAEHFLPEVEAAGRTCGGGALVADVRRKNHGIGTAIPGEMRGKEDIPPLRPNPEAIVYVCGGGGERYDEA